jgi:alanine racemase
MRPILATISQSALRHNLAVVRQHAPHSQILAAVKANAYGHGIANVADALSTVDGFAVLDLAEAITLREMGFKKTIVLLEGIFSTDELAQVQTYDLSMVVHHHTQLEMLEQTKFGKAYSVYLKMNTGMNRLGFAPHAFSQALARVEKLTHQVTLMTHFAAADERQGVNEALAVFNQVTHHLPYPKSLANSAAILDHPQTHAQWVRPGIMLYGASPSDISANQYQLQAVMRLNSQIISTQQLQTGQALGYGNRFVASKPMRVGVVACGYADGYPRHAGQYSKDNQLQGVPTAVAGKRTQTVGRVSMDMLFADITNIPEATVGSPVELWGQQVAVDEVAQACGTIGYELLCAVASRVSFKVVD